MVTRAGTAPDWRELCRAWFQPALTEDDREWIRQHLELAGLEPPGVDLSWPTTELVRW